VAYLSGSDKARYVRKMFSRLPLHYDLMNRIMTAWQDIRWRQEVIQLLNLPKHGKILDLGAGTGDLAKEAYRKHPDWHCVAADFTLEMMQAGVMNNDGAALDWVASDALLLPFSTETFFASVSGFLLRNVGDIDQALREQYRVLKPNGKIVVLDTTRPADNLMRPLINFHLHKVIPLLGALITRERDAYTYLPISTDHFLDAEQLAARMVLMGFQGVGFRRLMFGTVAIHWGIKPGI
jgi:demethylmenaquinone methyltransferase / 2-methoxy-6-polyprenyl-1,4-benzoquinol methylase